MEQILVNKTRKIKRNALKCLRCGDTIESNSLHDCVTCSCGRFTVDGGHEYIKRSFAQGMLSKDFVDLTEYEEVSDEEAIQDNHANE